MIIIIISLKTQNLMYITLYNIYFVYIMLKLVICMLETYMASTYFTEGSDDIG